MKQVHIVMARDPGDYESRSADDVVKVFDDQTAAELYALELNEILEKIRELYNDPKNNNDTIIQLKKKIVELDPNPTNVNWVSTDVDYGVDSFQLHSIGDAT